MSRARDQIAASDALISALAERRPLTEPSIDVATRELQRWTAHLDERVPSGGRVQLWTEAWPMAGPSTSLVSGPATLATPSLPPPHLRRRRSKVRILQAALAASVVLTVSSTSLAAAVSGERWPSDRLMDKIAQLSQVFSPEQPARGHLHTHVQWGGGELEHGDGGRYAPETRPTPVRASTRVVLTASRPSASGMSPPAQQGR